MCLSHIQLFWILAQPYDPSKYRVAEFSDSAEQRLLGDMRRRGASGGSDDDDASSS